MIGKKRYWIYALLFSLNVINYLDRINMSVAAKPIATEFKLSPVELGYLFSSFYWIYIFCLLPGGYVADKIGTRRIIAMAVSLWSVTQAATGLAGSYISMLLMRIGLGVGEAPTNPAASRILREWAPFSERGLSMSIFTAGSYAGPAVGAALTGVLIQLFGWRLSFGITGAAGLVWLAVWMIWVRPPERASWLGEPERKLILSERETNATQNSAAGTNFRTLLSARSMWGVALTQGCMTYNQYLFLAWLPGYLETSHGLSVLATGYYTMATYAIAVLVSIAVSLIADRRLTAEKVRGGQRRLSVCVTMIAGAVVMLIPLTQSLPLILILITVSLTFCATALALNFTLTNDLVAHSGDVGKAFGVLTIGGNLAGLMAPIVTGYVIQYTGSFGSTFVISGCMLLIGSVIVMAMTHRPIGETAGATGAGPIASDATAAR